MNQAPNPSIPTSVTSWMTILTPETIPTALQLSATPGPLRQSLAISSRLSSRPPGPHPPLSTPAPLSQPSRYQTPGQSWETNEDSGSSDSSSNSSKSDSDSDSESSSSSTENSLRTRRKQEKGKKRKRRTTKDRRKKRKKRKKNKRGSRLLTEGKKVVLRIAAQDFEVYAYAKTKARFWEQVRV